MRWQLTDQSARAAYEADILEAHEQVKVQALEIDSLKLQVATAEGQRQAYNSAQKQLEQQEALISSLREEVCVGGGWGKSVTWGAGVYACAAGGAAWGGRQVGSRGEGCERTSGAAGTEGEAARRGAGIGCVVQ